MWPKKSSPAVWATTRGTEATPPLDDFPKLLIDLGREQIRGQEATTGVATTKVLGLLGFDGVSTPLVIANRHVFGYLWWVLLLAAAGIVVGAVIVLWGRPHDRGPDIGQAYEKYAGQALYASYVSLVAELAGAVRSNGRYLGWINRGMTVSLTALVVGLVVAGLLAYLVAIGHPS